MADGLESSGLYDCEVVDGRSTIGGGTTPGLTLPTRLLALTRRDSRPTALEAALRRLDPPVIARIERDRVVLDLRTVFEDEDAALADGLRTVAGARQQASQKCLLTIVRSRTAQAARKQPFWLLPSVFCPQNMLATERAARSRTRVGSTPR